MTEDEAKRKWCPFARSNDGEGNAYNRTYEGEPDRGTMCIASRCMSWDVTWSRGDRVDGDCRLMRKN
jgi:hypothetical protein